MTQQDFLDFKEWLEISLRVIERSVNKSQSRSLILNLCNLKNCPRCKSDSLGLFQASKTPPPFWNDREYYNIRCECGLNGPTSLSEDGAIFGWNADTWIERINLIPEPEHE